MEVITERTGFYIESGGQVSDQGQIVTADGRGKFAVEEMRKPSAGMIVHYGKVVEGTLKVGDDVTAGVDHRRRQDTQRNHTATHLLHAELRKVLGEHVRQAGSLVAPDRLRFDFTHQKALSAKELSAVEEGINQRILDNYPLTIAEKKLTEAQKEGATALFGENTGMMSAP